MNTDQKSAGKDPYIAKEEARRKNVENPESE